VDRAEVMRRVRGRDTGPERAARRLLRAEGLTGYRLDRRDLPGRPDIAFIGRRAAIFVHGCFWHGHDCPRGARAPKANAAYWCAKIARNRARDAAALAALAAAGWRVMVVWECGLRAPDLGARLAAFVRGLTATGARATSLPDPAPELPMNDAPPPDAPLPALAPNPAALDFLLTRRSRPAKTLGPEGPDAPTLRRLLTAAARVPDHGKLEPWRFLVIEGAARARLAGLVRARAAGRGLDAAAGEKAAAAFTQGALVVAVVASPKPSEKIPEWEQLMSVGCVCLSLVNAALAAGWGANWLSGWAATDRPFLDALGLTPREFVAGFVHIGAETVAPSDRPRPSVDALVTRLSA
jgi:DNA mismatch endonuclease Vsr